MYETLVTLDLEEEDDLFVQHAKLEKLHFSCSHKVRKLLNSHAPSSMSAPAADGKGFKLPKLEVPTFDGDVLHWRQFWEQFSISVHDRSHLTDVEKLVYLRQASQQRMRLKACRDLETTTVKPLSVCYPATTVHISSIGLMSV